MMSIGAEKAAIAGTARLEPSRCPRSQFSERISSSINEIAPPYTGTPVANRVSMRLLVLLVTIGLGILGEGCGSGSLARGDGGKTCDQLVTDYHTAVNTAGACTPGAPNQCQAPVPAFLCAGCNLYVNDGTQAIAVQKQFFDQGCDKTDATSCSLEPCTQVGPFACVASDGGSLGGFCSTSATAAAN
jgi:hypothetical protein